MRFPHFYPGIAVWFLGDMLIYRETSWDGCWLDMGIDINDYAPTKNCHIGATRVIEIGTGSPAGCCSSGSCSSTSGDISIDRTHYPPSRLVQVRDVEAQESGASSATSAGTAISSPP